MKLSVWQTTVHTKSLNNLFHKFPKTCRRSLHEGMLLWQCCVCVVQQPTHIAYQEKKTVQQTIGINIAAACAHYRPLSLLFTVAIGGNEPRC